MPLARPAVNRKIIMFASRFHPAAVSRRAAFLAAALATALTIVMPVSQVQAQEAVSKDPALKIGGPEANIRHLLEGRMRTGVKIDGVTKSPYFNLYEVRVGSDLLYTDEHVTYIFAGSVLDGKSMENLTEERINKLTAVNFDDLPLKDSIKLVNGTGRRQMAYFTDPNCPYCKQLEKTLTQVKDTTVYVFLYPILSEDSVSKAKVLWCAPDRARAWSDWMLRGQMASNPGTCDTTAIDSNHALGQRLNVRATPTLVMGNGQRIPGALPVAQLEQALADSSK
jgi:thiol:disulfide interchange protein DsbC